MDKDREEELKNWAKIIVNMCDENTNDYDLYDDVYTFLSENVFATLEDVVVRNETSPWTFKKYLLMLAGTMDWEPYKAYRTKEEIYLFIKERYGLEDLSMDEIAEGVGDEYDIIELQEN